MYITNLRENKVAKLKDCYNLKDKMVLPCDLLYNEEEQFIGYTMPYYKDAIDLEKYFNRYQKNYDELYEYCMNISKYFEYFHYQQICLPDFNFRNVLLLKNQHLLFCDADSVKVDNWPATMNSSFMLAHYHSKNQPIIETPNFDKELLICYILNKLYKLNIAMLDKKQFKSKINTLMDKYEFTNDEIEQFLHLKDTDFNFRYPHEFIKPIKKKAKSSFWF